mmetsp:Transcript_56333/g.174798  ORF Transcript_56333/g.174798 Transcript_56333/m.174798 type:complete len:109 (+) Transcript_56333:606-932(+)
MILRIPALNPVDAELEALARLLVELLVVVSGHGDRSKLLPPVLDHGLPDAQGPVLQRLAGEAQGNVLRILTGISSSRSSMRKTYILKERPPAALVCCSEAHGAARSIV